MPRAGSTTAIPTMSPRSPISGPSPAIPAAVTRTGRWLPPAARIELLRDGCIGPVPRHLGFAALLLAGLLAACNGEAPPEEARQEEKPKPEAAAPSAKPALLLERVAFSDLPGWATDEVSAALPARRRSCGRSEEHTSELQSLMRISSAV